jgi:HK97 family phage portal protein
MTKKPGKIKSAVLSWLGHVAGVGPNDEEFWRYFASSSSGQTITPKTMLTLSTVWACARLISETIATLPLKLYERTPNGRRVASEHSLYEIIHSRPNANSSASMTWQAAVAAMLLRGAARFEKQYVGQRVVGIVFLPPDRLSITQDSQGNKQYRFTNDNGTQRIIPASKIMTIPGFTLDGVNGVSVIEYGANIFGSALAAESAASSTFKRGLLPTVAFKIAAFLTDKNREDFRENFKKIAGAVNAGEPALLEGGMDAVSIGINPDDAQLLESRGFSVEEVCRFFRVFPWMVGHASQGQTKWGSGMEQEMLAFLSFTLQPWLTRITQTIWMQLLTPAEQGRYYAEFEVNGLLRSDTAGRSAFYREMVNNGILTRDECREMENRERRGGNADVLTVNTATSPLDDIGTARTTIRNLLRLEPRDET